MADKKTEDKKKVKGFTFAKLKTDKKLEVDGKWEPYESTFEVKVARTNNPRYKEFITKRSKPHMRRLRRGTLDNEIAEKIMRKAVATTILVDWRGVFDLETGEEIPYTPENALQAFEEVEDFYDEIVAMADDRARFLLQSEEAARKNS